MRRPRRNDRKRSISCSPRSEGLTAERGDDGKIWSSHVKQILKRRRPGFNESYYGFNSFNALLEEAAKRNLITLEREGKSGSYIVRAVAD